MGQIKHILPLAFLCTLFSLNAKAQSISDTLEQKILNAQSEGRVVDNLNNSFALHPTGEFLLASTNRNLKFGILIYNIDILPDKAVFSAGMAFRDPKSNQLVAFRADNIAFSNEGGLTGPVKLYLISDIVIEMGQAAKIVIQEGVRETYAVFECKGLQEFGIKGRVDFNSEFLLPVDTNGDIKEDEKVTANFNLKAKSWTDILVQFSIQPFQVKGLKNYVFNITGATLDLSESINAAGMKFPLAYNASEIIGSNTGFWEGFYLQKGSVTFPDHFQNDLHRRVELGVTDLLIDEFGFSGTVFGNKLLDFEKGHIANWRFSIEYVEISFLMNELVRGQLLGDLGLPILPDTSKLHYSAYIGMNDNYGMLVSMRNNLTIPAFKVSEMRLTPNSYIDMQIDNGKMSLVAELNGEFLIENNGSSSSGGAKFSFPSIAFQGFRVASSQPVVDIQYLGFKSASGPSRFSGYPLNIQEVYLQKVDGEKRIGIRFGLNLMEKVAVKASIIIVAEYSNDKLQFRKLDIAEIDVKSVMSCFTMEGRINFIKEDPVFGNGFSGNIKFTMDKPKLGSDASVLFGNANNHRYWYFDASVMWGRPGIPFLPGAEINGFMGGAFHGMRELNVNDHLINPAYGLTASGKYYVPDVSAGLGLKAAVYLRSTGGNDNSAPFIAKMNLELQFNAKNGLNRIALYGTVDIMTQNSKTEKADLQQSTASLPALSAWNNYKAKYKPLGKIGGPMMMEFDFTYKAYQANFAVYVQGIAGNKIMGAGANGLAGECSVFFSPENWYFWIGTPKQPISLRMNMGMAGNAAVSSYFMAGKEVMPAEPLPGEITNILGNKNAGAMRKLNEMAAGNAFAFGSRLNLQIGSSGSERNVSIYASLKAIIGFDINVAGYGKNVFCQGHSGPPGINGWYANGQLFAFLQGKLGANYKVAGQTGELDLMTLAFASELYCQGPNPFYAGGSAVVQVNIAGVINKQMDLNFEIGEQCQLIKTKFSDTVIILETEPNDGGNKISTTTVLKTKFSVAIGQPFTDAEGRQCIFQLKNYEVSENGQPIKGSITWNEVKNMLSFSPENLLPGNRKIKVRIIVEASVMNSNFITKNADGSIAVLTMDDKIKYLAAVDKMKKNNLMQMDIGKGRKIIRSDRYETIELNGKKVEELKVVYFTTSANPENIPDVNIALTYPVKNQLNYYKKTSDKGYVELRADQDYLLKKPDTKIMAMFVDSKGTVVGESKVSLSGKRLLYTIPNDVLVNDAVYQLVVKIRSINAASEIGHSSNRLTAGIDDNKMSSQSSAWSAFTSTANSGSAGEIRDLVLLSYYFATSKYVSLEEKLRNMEMNIGVINADGIMEFKLISKKGEYFDCAELKGGIDLNPLIRVKTNFNGTPWFVNGAQGVYSIFNSKDAALLREISLSRDTFYCGFIPGRSVVINEESADKMLLSVKSGSEIGKLVDLNREIRIENSAFEIISEDLNDIKNGLIKYVSNNKTINESELNRYLTIMNKSVTSGTSGKMISVSLNNGSSYQSGLLSAGLISGPAQLFGSSPNSGLPASGNPGNYEWILKISRLKLCPLYSNSDYPVIFYYTFPGDSKALSSFIFNSYTR